MNLALLVGLARLCYLSYQFSALVLQQTPAHDLDQLPLFIGR